MRVSKQGHPFNLRPSEYRVGEAYLTPTVAADQLPPKIVVPRPSTWPIWNQGALGSCSAHASLKGTLYAFNKFDNVSGDTMLSRLFAYFNGRVLEGTTGSDSGVTLGDMMAGLGSQGVPFETLWPYDISKFAMQPPAPAFADGKKRLVISSRRLASNWGGIRQGLATGLPVVFGMTVYESFENTGSNGMVAIPKGGETVLGGHAMIAWEADTLNALVGTEDRRVGSWLSVLVDAIFHIGHKATPSGSGLVLVENSWGEGWGDHGYCHMDASLFDQNCFDAYQVTSVKWVA